jgi:hypothetical protein
VPNFFPDRSDPSAPAKKTQESLKTRQIHRARHRTHPPDTRSGTLSLHEASKKISKTAAENIK